MINLHNIGPKYTDDENAMLYHLEALGYTDFSRLSNGGLAYLGVDDNRWFPFSLESESFHRAAMKLWRFKGSPQYNKEIEQHD